MPADVRISTGLPGHPKTKKLIRRLGPQAGWSLVCLFAWVAANRSDGDLSRMTVEDIELAAEWGGDLDVFGAALLDVGFLDGEPMAYRIHDWADHNPWANGADMRSAKARWNAAKRHHGEAEADRQVPEWAAMRNAGSTGKDAGSNAHSKPAALLEPERSNAPSPSPSPSEEDFRLSADAPPAAGPARPSKPKAAEQEKPKTADVWEAYSSAYAARYGVEPLRNAKVNGALANLLKRIPTDEAPAVARFFVGSEDKFYVNAGHPVDLLLRDAEKLRTATLTGGGSPPSRTTGFGQRNHAEGF